MTTLEITATYFGERFRFANGSGDVIVGDAEYADNLAAAIGPSLVTVKGPDDEGRPLRQNRTYRFYGRWSNYTNKRTNETEKQFHFATYVEAEPASRAGVIAYLKECGRGNGIGQGIAIKVWEKFGSDSVRLLREQPEVVAAGVNRLSIESARVVAEILKERQAVEHCTVELMGLLDRRGFPKTTAKRAIAVWGNLAADLIKRNPFLLMMRFRGVGFRVTDKFYLELGLDPGRLKRQALCAWYSIASDTSGHTWYPTAVACQGIDEMIAGAEPRHVPALSLAIRGRLLDRIRVDQHSAGVNGLRIVDRGGRLFLAESKAAANERYIARQVVDAESESANWGCWNANGQLTDHQTMHLADACRGAIGILGGGPGCGKTYTAAALIQSLAGEKVAVAAPTGKAAVRITEALAGYGIKQRAKTIHSLLGVESSEDGWRFRHNENNPLDVRYLVVDEASMIDTDLMSSLLAARSTGTHILFVGDVGQLPPVGHGAPLRDMIRAGVPYGELTEIRRNSGEIVEACADIRAGREFNVGGNLVHRPRSWTPEEQKTGCLEVVEQTRILGLDPIWDCQIVTAVNAKSKVSRRELNKFLQAELNHNPGVIGSPFREGDKVVNTQNGFYPLAPGEELGEDVQQNERGEVYVANGELAEVLQAEPNLTIARLDNPRRTIKIPRGQSNTKTDDADDDAAASTGCNFDLGYCLSVHKSQGSEWPIVGVVIDEYPGARMICSREWIYTGLSRAKKECHLIGKLETAHRFCRRQQIDQRQTFLVESIERERAALILAEL